MNNDQDIIWLTIGKIVAPQGLRGDVRVNPSSDFPERFLEPGKRWLQNSDEEPNEIYLSNGRKIPGKFIYVVTFEGVQDRNQAKALVGRKLLINANQRPKLKKGEFHLLDLIGLNVKFSKEEESIGSIINLTNSGNDLLEVKLISGKTVLIPFVKEIVPEIHLEERWIRITPPKGLLEL